MNTTDSLIKKYENLKGDALDNWQECTKDVHKTMWEAYNLAYGQILSDLEESKEQQAEQIRLYEKTLDITTDQLMKVQAERNELKEYKIAEKEYPGQILNAGQHGVIIRKQRDAFIKGYKCKAAQSSPVKAAQPQQPKETKWSKLNTEMDSALNSLEFDKWAEAKEQPSGKVLENITDRQLNQIWSAVTEDWVFANFVEKFREVADFKNNKSESGKVWDDIFLEYSKACSLELEAVKYIIPLKDWLNRNYPMQ